MHIIRGLILGLALGFLLMACLLGLLRGNKDTFKYSPDGHACKDMLIQCKADYKSPIPGRKPNPTSDQKEQ